MIAERKMFTQLSPVHAVSTIDHCPINCQVANGISELDLLKHVFPFIYALQSAVLP